MSLKRINVALLAAATLWSGLGYCEAKSEAQLSLEREQAQLNQQIAAKQQQITTLRNRPSPEQAELTEAQQVVTDARAAYKANPNGENEAKVKNAEFKYTLVERKYSKAHADVEALVEEVDKLRQQVAAKQQQIKSAAQQASEQQAAATSQQQQRLAEERAKRQQQEQELQRTKQETETQQREIERLKALLAAKEAAAAKPVEAPKPAAPEAAKTAAAATPAASPAQSAPAANTTTNTTGLYKLVSQQEVVQELQAMEKRLASTGDRDRGGVSDVMYVKRPNTKATNKDRVALKSLGHEQYRGETQIDTGSYELVIGFNRWTVDIAAGEGGNLVILYDNSEAKKPRLFIYNQKLEGK